MPTIAQLKRRRKAIELKNKALRERNAARRALFNAQKDKEDLRQEIKTLKNPRTVAFKKNLKRGITTGGRTTLKFLDDLTRPVPVRKRTVKKTKKRKRR